MPSRQHDPEERVTRLRQGRADEDLRTGHEAYAGDPDLVCAPGAGECFWNLGVETDGAQGAFYARHERPFVADAAGREDRTVAPEARYPDPDGIV